MPETITDEGLSKMVQQGFEGLEERLGGRIDGLEGSMDGIEKRMNRMEHRMDRVGDRLNHLDARMGRMEADLNEIRSHIVYRSEFDDLMVRVKYLETNTGIESGKQQCDLFS